MRRIDLINHYLISSGTQYFADESGDNEVIIRSGITFDSAIWIGVFNADELLAKLEKCGSSGEVREVIGVLEWGSF